MPLGEILGHNEGFKVEAQGAPLLHRWMRFQQQINSETSVISQGIHTDPVVRIGSMNLEDPVLQGMGSGFYYDPRDETYNFVTQMYPQGPDPDPSSALGSVLMTIMQERGKGRTIPTPETLDLSEVLRHLRGKLPSNEFDVKNGRRDSISIQFTALDGQKVDIKVSSRTQPLQPPYYELSLEAPTSNSDQELEFNYQQYATVLGHVVDSIYRSKSSRSPSETYKMSPPNNLESQMEQAEREIKMRRRMLGASGLEEEDFTPDIERIIMDSRPDVSMDDIGGQENAKTELNSIIAAIKRPELFSGWGTRPPSGVLLVGPPGTGKTMLGKAVAAEAEATIYIVRIADIVHSLYGRSERFLQALLDHARTHTPSILFFDEIDALTQHREQSTEVTSRIVNVIATGLDGVYARGDNSVIIGATNRPEAIDSSLLRPRRFDMIIPVGLPTDIERQAIFNIHMRKAQDLAAHVSGRIIFDQIDMATIIRRTRQFSGADIEEIVRRALASKVQQEMRGEHPVAVTTADIVDVINNYESIRKAKGSIGFHRDDSPLR